MGRIVTQKKTIKESVIKVSHSGTGSETKRISLTAINDGEDANNAVGIGMLARFETQAGVKEVYITTMHFSTLANGSVKIFRDTRDTPDHSTTPPDANKELVYAVPPGFHSTVFFRDMMQAGEEEFSDKDILVEITGDAFCYLTLRKSSGYITNDRPAERGPHGLASLP